MDAEQKLGAGVSVGSSVAAGAVDHASLAIFGVPLSVVLAAFAGSMISLTFISGQGWRRAIGTVLSGTIAGSYLAPFAMKLFDTIIPGAGVLPVELDKPVAFLIALGFQVLAPMFLKWLERKGS